MAKTRGQGEGSIYKRASDGLWTATLNLGWENGKRKRKSFYGQTQAEVGDKLVAARSRQQQGLRPVPDTERVGPYLTRWLEDTHRSGVRLRTYAAYESLLRMHIVPGIGHLKLARLTADDLDAFYRRLQDKGLSARTIGVVHAILHRALTHARRRGAVAANVAADARPPRPSERHEFNTLLPEEAHRLLEATRSDRQHALYHLALTTGLRRAELLGLRWRDIDEAGATLSVSQQAYRIKGEWHYSAPKTARGRRTVSLSASTLEALREHRQAQNVERMAAPTWADNDLVFAGPRGEPTPTSTLSQRFAAALRLAGLAPMRFHDLRHTAATLLFAQGVHPKVVQEMLGHSSISVTLDVYSHTLPSMQREAADTMEKLLADAI